MTDLLAKLAPEILLTLAAAVLLLMGCSQRSAARRATPFIALLALLGALALSIVRATHDDGGFDRLTQSIFIDNLVHYMRILSLAVAIPLLLLAWPTRADGSGNSAMDVGLDTGEFFGLFLLSVAGLLLTAAANDLIVLFLAMELVSIPTYIMVSISRPQAVAQEAGVKYFFLGAMSVAVMLFGFSYLYGSTGQIAFHRISAVLRGALPAGAAPSLTAWQQLGVLLVLLGFAFKMAAFPLHFYAADVYEGAATPVTAFLAYVPKAAGFIALIRLLQMVGGANFALPEMMVKLLWAVAALTMTIGNVLGLLQNNVKRVLAYSSIAHSGYMLVALAAIAASPADALRGVLFYLAAYGIMNAAAFGVLMLLPSPFGRESAETFDDLAGQGRRHIALGLAMAVACFSLIGIPLTVGFLGKVLLIKPAFSSGMTGLVIILVVNAAISAAYYLRIVATLFLRPQEDEEFAPLSAPRALSPQRPVLAGVVLSVLGTLVLGAVPQATEMLLESAATTAKLQPPQAVEGSAAVVGPVSVQP